MQFAGQTDIGLVRKTNQDAYNAGALSENAVWAVVCDGMAAPTAATSPVKRR